MWAHGVGDVATADEASLRYPGWRVVAAMFLLQITIFGFGLYGQGIYVAQLHRLNGWPLGVIGAGSTLCLVSGNILSILVSELLRWIGPRTPVLTGIAALVTSLTLIASAQSILQLYAGLSCLQGHGWVSARSRPRLLSVRGSTASAGWRSA